MTTTQAGNLSESVVMSAYIKAGFLVAVPFGNACPYDLVVDNGARLFKIQVKTGWQRKGCLIYKGQRRIKDSTRNAMRPYREDEVDFFAIYFPIDDRIYVVPSNLVNGDGCLRLNPVLNGQQKLVKMAVDYSWSRHVEQLREDGFSKSV